MRLKRFKTTITKVATKARSKAVNTIDINAYSLNCFGLGALGLGDLWGSINWLVNLGISENRKIKLSSNHHGFDVSARLRDIIDVLDIPNLIEIVDCPGKIGMDQYNFWTTKYHPTKVRWKNVYENKFCYQFDGASNNWRKNPPPEDIDKLTSWCDKESFIQLGKHLSIKQCVELASESSMFFGVCSGMSHLCHSVGLPVFILEYGLFVPPFHVNKKYTRCCGTKKFLEEAEKFKKHLAVVRSRVCNYRLRTP